ncbi:hypothetical protein NEMBOFW57_006449 [Staphylotrichum longicolle]|uniref:Cyclopropane-fatty-acyl-phospholipid synthase n=1 Tax=Staphylotrichum longicolle TaxID=669026 RepID=A0AAD4ESX0_9PEZI|nr:hypothetical protein NEMBOFW57_006449 [Staphylotrichum longicolle]
MAPLLTGSSLPGALLQPIAQGAAYLRNKLGNLAWDHSVAIARPAILSLFSGIEIGTLIIIDEPAGERLIFGNPLDTGTHPNGTTDKTPNGTAHLSNKRNTHKPPHATLTITSPAFYPRLLLLADMGFAASYLLHEAACPDLTAFFRLFVLNRARLGNGTTWSSSALVGTRARLLGVTNGGTGGWGSKTIITNTPANALLNAAAHYDLGNDMFAAFLSRDMTYSCPIWKEETGRAEAREEEGDGLEDAQMRKLRRVIERARISAADHVLEIGTGWGSFAIEAVKSTGCRVTSLTLSREQKGWAEERIEREGVGDRVEVLLMDYRDEKLPVPEGGYDKVVSIEMIEAVGKEFLGTYFGRVDRVLKRDGGIAVFQCITMPEGRHQAYSTREDFINRYIFPGGYLPSITQLLNHIAAASRGTLIVENVENIGGHYARALRLWNERFLAAFEDKIRPALIEEHPEMTEEEVEVFRRKWEYYFAYSEAGFLTKTLGDVIITVGREGAMELMEGIPL